MAYTGGIDYLPVPKTVSAYETEVEFDYPGPGPDARCTLAGPLWKIPAAACLQQCENFAPSRKDPDDLHASWVKYDNSSDSNGMLPEYLEFLPILKLKFGFAYGLLVEAYNNIYSRIGVASVQTQSDYTMLNRVTVA
jgi:hypothetical protein